MKLPFPPVPPDHTLARFRSKREFIRWTQRTPKPRFQDPVYSDKYITVAVHVDDFPSARPYTAFPAKGFGPRGPLVTALPS